MYLKKAVTQVLKVNVIDVLGWSLSLIHFTHNFIASNNVDEKVKKNEKENLEPVYIFYFIYQ